MKVAHTKSCKTARGPQVANFSKLLKLIQLFKFNLTYLQPPNILQCDYKLLWDFFILKKGQFLLQCII